MYREGRCWKCDNDYDQCLDCERKEEEQKEYIRNTKICQYSSGKVFDKNCRLKATSTKVDSCSACGYKFIYP